MYSARLLVVDGDSLRRQQVLLALTERFGDAAVSAAGSRAALVALDPATFDLIICELTLPDATGPDVVRDVRARCDTPVVLMAPRNCGRDAASAIEQGAADYVVRQGDYLATLPLVAEKNLAFARVRRERDDLHRRLREQNQTLNRLLRTVEEAAATDPLTGLDNRRQFGSALTRHFATAQRSGADLSCVMLDMDGFKRLNDVLGHPVGDRVLVAAADAVRAELRGGDSAARFGGDEFVLLLPGASESDAALAADRIRQRFATDAMLIVPPGVVGIAPTLSAGVAGLREGACTSADALIDAADRALYIAKHQGRDRVAAVTRDSLPAARRTA